MAAITFHINDFGAASTGDPTLIEHTVGSGLGFYGGGFGISVPVGQYQDTTFITDANGTTQGVKAQNVKYNTVSGNLPNGATVEVDNSGTPNYYAPLNIRFTHSTSVRVQNCKLRIFDRADIAKQASGVTTQVYEVRHPHPTEGESATYGALDHRGTANHSWVEYDPADSMADTTFTASPGISGLNTVSSETLPTGDGTYYNWIWNDGAAHEAVQHDWYVALSASPDSIGSKTDYGLYFTCEYL